MDVKKKRIRIEVSQDVYDGLVELARFCTECDKKNAGGTTDGPLTVAGLIEMLANDASQIANRSGSWEASGISDVLRRHGYFTAGV
ncbi:hypothetical protein [Acetobacter persici]|uniref:hypothetical protein n=1 Tax=Acetobacter persici TaxID=1076596 RepID=UPI001BAB8186|nr:hypothetical protein [Acetobacter persici]MBS1017100.1 hypothetical protein [Acetobacter persici]